MRRLFALAVFVAMMAFVVHGNHLSQASPATESTIAFGFLLLAAYLIGDALSWFRLPKITGYILAGLLFGPFLLNLIKASTIAELKLIDDMALTFIALAAGGELRLHDLKDRRKAIFWTVVCLTLIVSVGVAFACFLAYPLMPFLHGFPSSHRLAACLLVGTLAVARSPSSAIAVISETRARGPFTEMALGVTVVMDILVIALFAVVVSACQPLIKESQTMDVGHIVLIVGQLLSSIGIGVGLGWLLTRAVASLNKELPVIILGVCFLVTFLSKSLAAFLLADFDLDFHLEPLLICVTAGLWVQNFSPGGDALMDNIDRSALPIFVIFFSLTGAALNLDALRQTWILALIIVTVRASLIMVGGSVAARIAGDSKIFQKMSGWAFITQAGVSLGLAGVIMRRFPDWGEALATVIVAIIAVNQIIGPVAFKYALTRVGEINRK